MVVEPALAAVQNYLRVLQTYGLPVRFGVVFGSQTTGQANQWSDIDLLVVSPQFDGRRERRDVDLLWRLAARTDSRIEPVPCGEHQWTEDTSSAIVEIARRDGQQVMP